MTEETLFELALKTPTAERAALLDRACEAMPELRERVEKLLAAHEAQDATSDGPLLIASTADAPLQPEDRVDQTVDRYRLLQKLGEGGMGAVWVAEQMHPVKRRVALKLIKAGMDSARIVARFEAERQALAMMDHPCIAKVLDAGTTQDGRPYFAMELVKGVPITQYCDEVQATIRERLELYMQTCGAVQHAHQKGIIHRDLKPSNILVAMHDGVAGPKVIDFGVAKALHSKLVEQTLYTEIGQVIGTLEYMAPEQAELSAMDIDTRADVYALGVLLFELLAGSTPITRERLKKAGYAEILRVIKEEEPPRPSTRLSASNESLPNLAARRRMEPKKLAAALAGELDWIALKALEKNRARRYETANALAADVRRYLADEPVEARPPSRWYRTAKFIRKHRIGVTAVVVTGLAILVGLAGTTIAMMRAMASEAKERKTYQSLLASTRRIGTVTELLRVAPGRVTFFEGSPEKAEFESVLQSLLQVDGTSGSDEEGLLLANLWASAAELLNNTGSGNTDEQCIRLLREADRMRTKFLPNDHPDVWQCRILLGSLLWKTEGFEKEGVQLLEQACARAGTISRRKWIEAAGSLCDAYEMQDDLESALRVAKEITAAELKEYGADNPIRTLRLVELAELQWQSGLQLDRIASLREAVRLFAKLMQSGRIRYDWRSDPRILLATALRENEHPQEAAAILKERLREDENSGSETEIMIKLELARALVGAKEADEKAKTLESALRDVVHCVGIWNERVPGLRRELAELDDRFGRSDRAIERLRENLAVTRVFGFVRNHESHFDQITRRTDLEGRKADDLAQDHRLLAGLLAKRGDTRAAMESARKALELNPKDLLSVQRVRQQADAGARFLKAGSLPEAERELVVCVGGDELLANSPADSSFPRWRFAVARSMLGEVVFRRNGDRALAESLMVEGIKGLKAMADTGASATSNSNDRPSTASLLEAADRLIAFYVAMNKPDEARKWRGEREEFGRTIPTVPAIKK